VLGRGKLRPFFGKLGRLIDEAGRLGIVCHLGLDRGEYFGLCSKE